MRRGAGRGSSLTRSRSFERESFLDSTRMLARLSVPLDECTCRERCMGRITVGEGRESYSH
jgi:hypothetical protein